MKQIMTISAALLFLTIGEVQAQNGIEQDKNELLTLWLADKVLDAIEDEDELKRKAIEVEQERIG